MLWVTSAVCADVAVKNEDMDEGEEDEDDETRRADLKGGFIKGQWTRDEDEKVTFPLFFVLFDCVGL